MRLAAVAKCGYYPASPVAMDGIVKHLRLAEAKRESQYILDPCAGEGLAIKAIADGLGVPHDHTYCVEIDAGRSQQIKANLPGVNLLGPATFMGVQCSGWSFGLAYVNAPFDDELGGGRREEQAFVQKATNLLAPRGIIVIVCPISKFIGNRSFVQFVDANFDSLHVYRFPDGHRPYNEIVVFGRKRKTPIPADALDEHGELHQREWQWRSYVRIENLPPLGSVQPRHWDGDGPSSDRHSDLHVWEIPHGWKPATWKKTGFTEEELAEALAASPLNAHFKDVAPLPAQASAAPARQGPPRSDPGQRHAGRGRRDAARTPRGTRFVHQGRVPQQGGSPLARRTRRPEPSRRRRCSPSDSSRSFDVSRRTARSTPSATTPRTRHRAWTPRSTKRPREPPYPPLTTSQGWLWFPRTLSERRAR